LFGFIAFACGGDDETARSALLEAGSKVGTAYQLADDILDATGDPEKAGKSLGSDESREKTTAVSAMANGEFDPVAFIERLCSEAESALAPWPAIATAWQSYMTQDLRPALDKNIASFKSR
jgi:geranylgeranyl pyrophosphate synthase